jgi:hypothetical protein
VAEVLTAAITVVLGFIVFVLGQVAQRFFIEPIQEQRRIIGEISFAVIYYHNVSSISPPEIRTEAQQTLRKLSAQLYATLGVIWPYEFFERRGWVARRENVEAAATGLIGWSNSLLTKDSPHASLQRSAVIKALGLPEQT